MEIGETFYPTTRTQWRKWLQRNHASKDEIWLVIHTKASGKPSLPYDDAVEEALCFGWIDSIVKPLGDGARAQRYSPRRADSPLSELNKERIRKLRRLGLMAPAGLAAVKGKMKMRERFVVPEDIEGALKEDPEVRRNFKAFPLSYRRIRVGFIDGARPRPEEFQKRLAYFLKMTKQNKTYGTIV